jgi:serine/threonine protein phosphatase PrpC
MSPEVAKISPTENREIKVSNLEMVGWSIPKEGRTVNQDRFLILPAVGLAAVFDGVGSSGGERAAIIAEDTTRKWFNTKVENRAAVFDKDDAEGLVRDCMYTIHDNILESKGEDAQTTGVIAFLWRDTSSKEYITFGSVGDSRAYEKEEGGDIEQIGFDDGIIKSLLDQKEVTMDEAKELQNKMNNITNREEFTAWMEYDIFHLRNKLTQILGDDPINPKITTIERKPKRKYLLATDGVTDNLTDKEINSILSAEELNNPQQVDKLIESSSARSKENHLRAKSDDMTAVIIDPGQL